MIEKKYEYMFDSEKIEKRFRVVDQDTGFNNVVRMIKEEIKKDTPESTLLLPVNDEMVRRVLFVNLFDEYKDDIEGLAIESVELTDGEKAYYKQLEKEALAERENNDGFRS